MRDGLLNYTIFISFSIKVNNSPMKEVSTFIPQPVLCNFSFIVNCSSETDLIDLSLFDAQGFYRFAAVTKILSFKEIS